MKNIFKKYKRINKIWTGYKRIAQGRVSFERVEECRRCSEFQNK
jgi:hypothetical protein